MRTSASVLDQTIPELDENDNFEENQIDEPHEEDLEETARQTGTTDFARETDEPTDDDANEADGIEDAPYDTMVKLFMETLLDNSLSTYVDYKKNPQNCHLCRDDETVSETQKASPPTLVH